MLRSTLFLSLFGLLFPAVHGQTGNRFIQNKGQWPREVTHQLQVSGAVIWAEANGWTLDMYDTRAIAALHAAHAGKGNDLASPSIRHHAVRMRFRGASEQVLVEGVGKLPGMINYILGNDPSRWAGDVPSFSELRYTGIHPGVDMVLRRAGAGTKYDIIVAANADPSPIAFTFAGADGLELREGELLIHTSLGTITQRIPKAYQIDDQGQEVRVDCAFRLEEGTVSFALGDHDRTRELVIDPTLEFSTFSGSTSDNFGYTATFDNDGFLYSGSTAFGQGYPTTLGAFQVLHAGGDGLGDGTDIAITKYDTTGTFFVWSTFLGGSGDELPHSLIVNNANEVFVYGTTSSTDFPMLPGSYDGTFNGGTPVNLTGLGVNFVNGSDMIVARLGASGAVLQGSTYLGGSQNDGLNTAAALRFNYADEVRGEVLLDPNNNVYIVSTTSSTDFPTTAGAYQPVYNGGTHDGVVVKLDASLSNVIWSTYFGGSNADAAYSVALDDAGALYIAGGTTSTDLPASPGALATTYIGGAADAFAALIGPNGSSLLACTYWGSNAYDQAYFVELDQFGQVYLFGQTRASANELIFNAPYNVPNSGQFLSKFDPLFTTLELSSRFGTGNGNPNISPTAFLVDYCDKIYISGWGSSIQGGTLSTTGLPVTPDAYQPTTTGNDFYLAVFDIDLQSLFYATYFGGDISAEHVDGGTSRFDRRGRVYQSVCAGCGANSDFPIEPNPGAVSATNNSPNCNNGVFKFDFNFPIVVAGFQVPPVNCLPAPITFNNTSYGAASYLWDFGDNTTSTLAEPSHLYATPGVYSVSLIAFDPNACNLADTAHQQVVVLGNTGYSLGDATVCAGESVQIGILPVPDPNVTYQWSPVTGLSSVNVSNPFATPAATTTYQLLISNGTCTDTVTQTVVVASSVLDAGATVVGCGPAPVTVTLTANGFGSVGSFQWSSDLFFSDTLNTPLTDSTATLTLSQGGTFYVRPLDNACASPDSVQVVIELAAPFLTGDTLVCADEPAQLQVIGAGAGSTFQWTPAQEIQQGQGTSTVVVAPELTSTYAVAVESAGGCIWAGTITVNVSPVNGTQVNATVDQAIVLPGTTVQLNATPTSGVTYAWSPAGAVSDPLSNAPTALVTETTWFVLTVTDGICTRSDSVLVTVYELNCDEPDIFVPNAFTPNGDGNNDVLFVRGRFITTLLLQIFDRWGEKVFETSDQAIGWDGTYKGKRVDPAVFVYHLTVDCADGQRYFKKGNVSVIE